MCMGKWLYFYPPLEHIRAIWGRINVISTHTTTTIDCYPIFLKFIRLTHSINGATRKKNSCVQRMWMYTFWHMWCHTCVLCCIHVDTNAVERLVITDRLLNLPIVYRVQPLLFLWVQFRLYMTVRPKPTFEQFR